MASWNFNSQFDSAVSTLAYSEKKAQLFWQTENHRGDEEGGREGGEIGRGEGRAGGGEGLSAVVSHS